MLKETGLAEQKSVEPEAEKTDELTEDQYPYHLKLASWTTGAKTRNYILIGAVIVSLFLTLGGFAYVINVCVEEIEAGDNFAKAIIVMSWALIIIIMLSYQLYKLCTAKRDWTIEREQWAIKLNNQGGTCCFAGCQKACVILCENKETNYASKCPCSSKEYGCGKLFCSEHAVLNDPKKLDSYDGMCHQDKENSKKERKSNRTWCGLFWLLFFTIFIVFFISLEVFIAKIHAPQ